MAVVVPKTKTEDKTKKSYDSSQLRGTMSTEKFT